MWKTDPSGVGQWQVDQSAWTIHAGGGNAGIAIVRPGGAGRYGGIEPVGGDRLPTAGEQYVRRHQWHIDYPQGDGSYALKVVFTPVEATAERLILEATLSIQTSLLDTHPTLDLCAPASEPPGSLATGAEPTGGEPTGGEPTGAAPIHWAGSADSSVAILLGPHDRPFTQDRSEGGELRLRLFGDFLEKGVIRKARPWIWIQRGDRLPEPDELRARWKQLCDSPLPLMS